VLFYFFFVVGIGVVVIDTMVVNKVCRGKSL
jgi:hypothetical protein